MEDENMDKPSHLDADLDADNVTVRSKRLPRARMNNAVRLLMCSILFVGLSGFILLFVISGSLNGWWGDPWMVLMNK